MRRTKSGRFGDSCRWMHVDLAFFKVNTFAEGILFAVPDLLAEDPEQLEPVGNLLGSETLPDVRSEGVERIGIVVMKLLKINWEDDAKLKKELLFYYTEMRDNGFLNYN